MEYPASDEQSRIVNDVVKGNNVCVDAVAGSGKTTTILHIAKALPDKSLLVVTYNKQLRLETKSRINRLGITNVEMHTYHSACGTYFETHGGFEQTIKTVGDGTAALRRPINHHILVIDEVQDMNQSRHLVVKRFLTYMDAQAGAQAQIVILGDVYQCIYNFGSCPADPRYLTMCERLYNRAFVDRTLSTSYRVTHEIAGFINNVTGTSRLKAIKSGSKVTYLCGNPYDHSDILYDYVRKQLKPTGSYNPDDIFVLAHSTKQGLRDKPINVLENKLVQARIPVFRPLGDECELDEREIVGKVVISSFHQSKGRERKIVICYGFDSTYFKYSGKLRAIEKGYINPTRCPNEWYVALSRAIDHLVVSSGDYAPQWITSSSSLSRQYVNIVGKFSIAPAIKQPSCPMKVAVTDLVKYKTTGQVFNTLEQLYTPLLRHERYEQSNIVQVEQRVESTVNDITMENVADITALAISLMYEAKSKESKESKESKDTKEWLRHAAAIEAVNSGYINRLNQIKSFDWLSELQRDKLLENYQLYLGHDPYIILEREVNKIYTTRFGKITVYGRLDAISKGCVWEFKLSTAIKPEHILQLIIYSSLTDGTFIPKLLNIRTGECITLAYDRCIINNIMELLFDTHYGISKTSNSDFLQAGPESTDSDSDLYMEDCLI